MWRRRAGKDIHCVGIRMIDQTLSVYIKRIVPISDYQDCVWGAGGQGRTYSQC